MTQTKDPTATAEQLILLDKHDGVMTLTMNAPRRLNGWTRPMMEALKAHFKAAAADDETRVLVLTGADPYYCAGVNLAGIFKPMHPRRLRQAIIANNQALFDAFLDFPKPILAAVNGPAIGASVTSATLCDGIVASERATFWTPFGPLCIPPEGCSSVLFERLMGAENAARMLFDEGWRPDAGEALEAGLVQWVVPHDQLLDKAHEIAREWAAAGATRSYRGGSTRDELKAVNASECIALADAFLASPFLEGRFRFFLGKKKWGSALMFLAMWLSRPAWARML
ncbi:MAG: enoyl-CoA hydratase/isomerase family protein [Lysobacterales bacterium]|jgi:enoyl-CoA hydratase/carnithine racemase